MKMKTNCAALTIAGSDSGGGAGIQADLKTFSAMGVFGTSVITAVTAQNLDGVTAIQPIDTDVVHKQAIAVLEGFPVKAIKTGMLFSKEIIETITGILTDDMYKHIPLIIDPVFAATSGSKLIEDDAIEAMIENLFPLAAVITPNMPEAEILTGLSISNREDLERAGQKLYDMFGTAVLMKGGHMTDRAVDIFFDSQVKQIYESELIEGVNNHGSGCTLASAIAAAMAKGDSLRDAVYTAKNYITNALKESLELSTKLRVMNHFFVKGEE
jgi:hydroxymethylpyrimidine/phosphomethylpyrimidine kinase